MIDLLIHSSFTATITTLKYITITYVNKTATGYELDGPEIESRWERIFRTCPDRPWGPPSLLYNGYRVFPGGTAAVARHGVDHPTRSKAEVKERVELYLYSPSGPSWPVLG